VYIQLPQRVSVHLELRAAYMAPGASAVPLEASCALFGSVAGFVLLESALCVALLAWFVSSRCVLRVGGE
jgi:hypothetical protein